MDPSRVGRAAGCLCIAALASWGAADAGESVCPRTLEDIYGPTGNSFQGAIGFLNFEARSSQNLPETGFGLAIDDVVVEWREFRLDGDTTSCAAGQCAVLDLATTNFFEGNALLDLTLIERSPYGSRCVSTGFCTFTGTACAGSCPADEGVCERAVCFSGSDCPNTDCAASANDCDGDGDFFGAGDDSDCDGDGTDDVVVRVTSESEPAGERVVLNLTAPDTYTAQVPISSQYDVPGVLLVQTQGTDDPTVIARYDDIDDGTGSQVCLNDVDPAGQGEVQAGTTVFLTPANIAITGVTLDDNRDGDGFADDFETVSMRVEVSNKTGVPLTNVTMRLATGSPDIDCILDTFAALGDLAVGESRFATDAFVFRVGDVGRTDPLASRFAEFTVTVAADQFDNAVQPQRVSIELDLDASGGSGPFTYQESFETGDFGSFTSMWIGEGLASLAASDGYRCQYNDPDWPNSNTFGSVTATDCFVNSSQVGAAFHFQVLQDRAYTGSNALYWGVPLGDPLGFTTPFATLEAVRSDAPINLGWDRVCSSTRTVPCGDAGDCPAGEDCVSAQPRLTYKQQISLLDYRSVGVSIGESADRAVVHLQVADAGGGAVGDWVKLDPIRNLYDAQGTDNYTNCLFDPIDDGNTEDDFFDPTDPDRRLGPSSTCFPEFAYVFQGDTFSPFSATNLGRASDGPGLQGSAGLGTWIEAEFPLDRFRGRRVRLRFLVTSLKLGSTQTVESAFSPYNPDPGDDGWWIDDVQVRDALTSPATIDADTKDNTGLPGCGSTCTAVDAALQASPAVLGAPGAPVELSAAASAADRCLDGNLQYRFWVDGDGNGAGGDAGDRLLRGWTGNAVLVDAPRATTRYAVDVRCATATDCADTQPLLLTVNCPASGNLGGVFQTVRAPDPATFAWTSPVDGQSARGALSGVASYSTAGGGTGAFFAATSYDASGDAPAPGAGLWYLFRNAAGGGGSFCNEIATWSSGGVGESPGRDTALP